MAVVGTGEWWGREHARVFSQRPDVELCAIVGRSSDKTTQRAAEFDTTPYVDLDEMLATETPDLVSLCLPNEGHFDTTLHVIEAGFPLLVEKPLVFDLDEADRLLQEADDRHLFFAINFNHRYARPVQMAHEAITSGALGDHLVRDVAVRWRGRHQHAPVRQPRSRRSATASTCSSTCAARSQRSAPTAPTRPATGTRRWPWR